MSRSVTDPGLINLIQNDPVATDSADLAEAAALQLQPAPSSWFNNHAKRLLAAISSFRLASVSS